MTWRFLTFIGFLLIGVVLGGSLEYPHQTGYGALCGVVAAALMWYVADASQASRLL